MFSLLCRQLQQEIKAEKASEDLKSGEEEEEKDKETEDEEEKKEMEETAADDSEEGEESKTPTDAMGKSTVQGLSLFKCFRPVSRCEYCSTDFTFAHLQHQRTLQTSHRYSENRKKNDTSILGHSSSWFGNRMFVRT